jgi:hypothetical protein
VPDGSYVRFDGAKLAAYLTATGGHVAQDLTRRALRVANRAKELAPVDTGRLRASIVWTIGVGGNGKLVARVGTNVAYARPVHEGSRPHVIRPRRGRVLVFPMGGRTVFARVVHHPGTRPHPFLRDALRAAA